MEDKEGKKPVTIWMDEDDILIGGLVILQVFDTEEDKRDLKLWTIGTVTPWDKIGWMETLLIRVRESVRK